MKTASSGPWLELCLTSKPGSQLVESRFTSPQLSPQNHPLQPLRAVRGKKQPDTGHLGWSTGIQALIAYLLRCAAWARRRKRGESVPKEPPSCQGPRPSLAATLSDVLTTAEPASWVHGIFGWDDAKPFLRRLIGRRNADANTVGKDHVELRLASERLPPENIRIFIEGQPLDDPDELEAIAGDIETQWQNRRRNSDRVPSVGNPQAVTRGNISTDGKSWQPLRQLLTQLDATTAPEPADRLWGEVTLWLLRLASRPQDERDVLNTHFPGRWGWLISCHRLQRYGRWSEMLKTTRTELQSVMDGPLPAGVSAIWAARAVNYRILAATRMSEENTAAECFQWLEDLFQSASVTPALRAQTFHYRGYHELNRRHFRDADQWLHNSHQSYQHISCEPPWRDIGLSHLLDTMAEHYAEEGEFLKSETHYLECLRLKDGLGDTYGRSLTHGKIGRLYLQAHQLEKAKESFQRDLAISREIGDPRGQTVALISLASAELLETETASESAGLHFQANRYLQEALSISTESKNSIGRGFAALGLGRALLLDRGGTLADLELARSHINRADELLGKNAWRPEWHAEVRLWHGWVDARLATDIDALRRADENWFVPAVRELRDSGLRFELAEALFQRARMLLLEGQRLKAPQYEAVSDCFCEAVEAAHATGAAALAKRYLACARDVDPQVWISTVTRHRTSVQRVTVQNQQLKLNLEQQLHGTLLTAHDLSGPVNNLWAICSNDPKPAGAWQRVEANVKRLSAIKEVLELMEDVRLLEEQGDVTRFIEDVDVSRLVDQACQRVRTMYSDHLVAIDVQAQTPIIWRTVRVLLSHIVHNIVDNAAKAALKSKDARQVEVRCTAAGDLLIDVLNTGPPLDAAAVDLIFRPGLKGAQRPAKRQGLYLCRYFARRLNGDVLVVVPSPAPWNTAFCVRLPPQDTSIRSG